MLNYVKSVVYVSLCSLGRLVSSCWQVGFSRRCFPDTHSLALETRRIASINFQVSTRLGRLAQSEISFQFLVAQA